MLEDCAFAVVDVETTGMRGRGQRPITEIAVVVVHAGGGRWSDSLVNPDG
jgi:DNA polymerase III epsilon subunit-like protein